METNCILCKRELTRSSIKNNKKKCYACIDEEKIRKVTSPDYVCSKFLFEWTRTLFINYYKFLGQYKLSPQTISKHLLRAEKLFSIAEKDLQKPTEISYSWVMSSLDKIKHIQGFKASLFPFLNVMGLLIEDEKQVKLKTSLEVIIERFPNAFKRGISEFCTDRLNKRERQVKNHSTKPLSLLTILERTRLIYRLVKFLNSNYPNISSFDLVQEDNINQFLLTFGINGREHARKCLYDFYRFLKRRKLIFYIPMANLPTREIQSSTDIPKLKNQKEIARVIQGSINTSPLKSLLCSLCFYHGLSSQQIRSIKLKDVNIENRKIEIVKRPPVFLSDDDLLALRFYLETRSDYKSIEHNSYLFVAKNSSRYYQEKPIEKGYLLNCVKRLSGYTPKLLRITCFRAFSSLYGPQFLIDAFGISMTHASRFGKLEEFIVEEELRHQMGVLT